MRRVLLLETDERAGLVAALTSACAGYDVSLEISTGPGHVLITFDADDKTTESTLNHLRKIGGVGDAHAYSVAV